MRLSTRILIVGVLVSLAVAAAVIRIQTSSPEVTVAASAESQIEAPEVEVTAAGYEIDLNLTPEVVEFEGFVNYGSPITATVADTDQYGNPQVVHLTNSRIENPVFSTRRSQEKQTTETADHEAEQASVPLLLRRPE